MEKALKQNKFEKLEFGLEQKGTPDIPANGRLDMASRNHLVREAKAFNNRHGGPHIEEWFFNKGMGPSKPNQTVKNAEDKSDVGIWGYSHNNGCKKIYKLKV